MIPYVKRGLIRRCIEATEIAKQAGINVRFAATLNKYNLNYVEDIIHIAHRYNTAVTFQPMECFQLGSRIKNPLVPEKSHFHKSINEILRYKRTHKYRNNIGNSFNGLKYFLNYPDVSRLECAFGRVAFRIEPNDPSSHARYLMLNTFRETFEMLT